MNHSFNVEIAEQYGINEAIILENLHFWILKNEANEKNYYEGRFWTYNSIKAFKELFPYMKESTIRRTLKNLEEAGLIVTGNFNKSSYDRTKWYALTKKGFLLFGTSICKKMEMDFEKNKNQNEENCKPIPDINKDKKTDINKDKKKHGEYENVFLSEQDIEKLKNEFPDYLERIERLSEYIALSGKKYKNHLAVIRNWARREQPKEKPKDRFKEYDIEPDVVLTAEMLQYV